MKEQISNMIGYLSELWERYSDEEWYYNWTEVIGMTPEQMQEYDLNR